MAFFKPVVWYFWAQVVNMMKADISGEPLQNFWKLVKGTPFYRGLSVVPVIAAVPVSVFKLMLNIKYPHSGC